MKVMSLVTRRKVMSVTRGKISSGSAGIAPPPGQKFMTVTSGNAERNLTIIVNGVEQPITLYGN